MLGAEIKNNEKASRMEYNVGIKGDLINGDTKA